MASHKLLHGKRALVVGLLNKHSLAASVARALLDNGAQVAVASRRELSASQRDACGLTPRDARDLHFLECDVEDDASIERLVARCGERFDGEMDVVVHSVAFAPKEALTQSFLSTSRAAWTQAMDVSAYSLVALTRATYPLLQAGGQSGEDEAKRDRSIVALSYAGASRVVPHYNVMGPAKAALESAARQLAFELGPDGIRVNCVSPGPMNTVSARGIPGISVCGSVDGLTLLATDAVD